MRSIMKRCASFVFSPFLKSTVRTSIFFWLCPNNQRSICFVSIHRLHQGGLPGEVAGSNARKQHLTHRVICKKAPQSQIMRFCPLRKLQIN